MAWKLNPTTRMYEEDMTGARMSIPQYLAMMEAIDPNTEPIEDPSAPAEEEGAWVNPATKWSKIDNKYTMTGIDGESYTVSWKGAEGFKVNNPLVKGTKAQVNKAIQYFLTNGEMPNAGDVGASTGQWGNVKDDLEDWMSAEGLTVDSFNDVQQVSEAKGITTPEETVDPITGSVGNAADVLFNSYYKDLYNPDIAGTGGAELLGDLEGAYQREANVGANMADVQFKNAAMQQAATVKQITDQVRAERMARLKSGMSESQIANQDMQMMMANVNTLNQNAAMLGDQRLQAGAAQVTAKDQAYMDYLNQANLRGQNAAAFGAADAGSADYMTRQRMYNTGEDYNTANPNVTGLK